MKNHLDKRLTRTHNLLIDILEHIDERHLASKLLNLPSNTIGQQFWCIVGARNSYVKAARAGSWQGFECLLTEEQILKRDDIKKELDSSLESLIQFLNSNIKLDGAQEELLLDLLEHEVQHHGQLIRYMYGLKLGVPESWKKRYNLD